MIVLLLAIYRGIDRVSDNAILHAFKCYPADSELNGG